jgi:hypothetical protein
VSPTCQERNAGTVPVWRPDAAAISRGDVAGPGGAAAPQGSCRPLWGQCPPGSTTGGKSAPRRLAAVLGAPSPSDIQVLIRTLHGSEEPRSAPHRGGASSVEPIATWPGFIDEDELLSLGLACADQVIDVGWSRPDGAEGGDLSTVVLRDIRDREGVFMGIETDVKRARLAHG